MLDNITRWLRGVIDLVVVLVVLGVVLQVLFPQALIFVDADVTGNLINLINKFSGAGLVGLIAFGLVYYFAQRR